MRRNYFTVGTFFGIQLRIDYSWFIIFALVAWAVITGYLPSYKHGLSPVVLTGAGLLVTVIFFVSVVAHEYAHSIVANHRGLNIKRITLFVFGGASELRREPDSAKTELLMTAAGPLTSLAIAGLFGGVGLLAKHWSLTALEIICQPVAALNFVVALFNLLPAFPLDGGRILRSILWMARKDFTAATRNAANAGVVLAYLMIAVGIFATFGGDFVGGVWFAIIGFFLLQSARLSYMQVVAQHILSGVQVSQIYNDQFAAIPLGTTVDYFLNQYVLRYKQDDFLAVDQAGYPVGVIEMSRVARDGERHRDQLIDDYVRPLAKRALLKPADPAAKALQIMQSEGLDILPVITQDKPIGVVLRRYLEDYMAVHRLQQ